MTIQFIHKVRPRFYYGDDYLYPKSPEDEIAVASLLGSLEKIVALRDCFWPRIQKLAAIRGMETEVVAVEWQDHINTKSLTKYERQWWKGTTLVIVMLDKCSCDCRAQKRGCPNVCRCGGAIPLPGENPKKPKSHLITER